MPNDDDFWNIGQPTSAQPTPTQPALAPAAAPSPVVSFPPAAADTNQPVLAQAGGSDDSWEFKDTEEEQAAEAALARALAAVQAGQNIDQVLQAYASDLPPHLRDKLRRRLGEEVQKKEMREHQMAQETRERSEGRGQGLMQKLFTMQMAAQLIHPKILDRIKLLVQQRPDIAQMVQEHGARMAAFGVTPEMVRVGEAQLGRIATPAIGAAQEKERGEGVGR